MEDRRKDSELGAGLQRKSQLRDISSLPANLRLFLGISIALTILSLGFSEVCRALHMGLPYSFPYYYVPGDIFSDFRGFWSKFQTYPEASFYTGDAGYFMYPMPLFFVFLAFFSTGHAFSSFIAFLLAATGGTVVLFVRAMKAVGLTGRALALFVTSVVILSYPLAYVYLRQNIEILIFALVTLGIVAYWLDHHAVAAFCFGLAGACKIYPLMLLGLPFSRKKYGSVLFGVAVAAGVTLVSLAAFGPSIRAALAWDSFQLSLFQKRYSGLPMQLGYDHSFFGLVKFATLPWRPQLGKWVPIYTRIAGISALALYFLRIIKLPRFNQVLILSILAITLPPISYDYTLLSLYPAFVLLCVASVSLELREQTPIVPLQRFFVLFAVIFTPLSFVTFYGGRYGAQVRAICLVALLVLALIEPIPDEFWPLPSSKRRRQLA